MKRLRDSSAIISISIPDAKRPRPADCLQPRCDKKPSLEANGASTEGELEPEYVSVDGHEDAEGIDSQVVGSNC